MLESLRGRAVVIKLGGSDELDRAALVEDLAALHHSGLRLVLVHGGGKELTTWLKRAGAESRFVEGLRVTDAQTLEIAVMVFAGKVNKEIVARLNAAGASALGLCGADARLLQAVPQTEPAGLGWVGKIIEVNTPLLDLLLGAGYLPVIAPVAAGKDGQLYNVNADTVAGNVAGAIGAARLVFVTAVPGVLDASGRTIPTITPSMAKTLRESGVISGGMIPKVEAALAPLADVGEVHIVDGSIPHALVNQLAGASGAGTRFTLD